jgi:hypothetical protein
MNKLIIEDIERINELIGRTILKENIVGDTLKKIVKGVIDRAVMNTIKNMSDDLVKKLIANSKKAAQGIFVQGRITTDSMYDDVARQVAKQLNTTVDKLNEYQKVLIKNQIADLLNAEKYTDDVVKQLNQKVGQTTSKALATVDDAASKALSTVDNKAVEIIKKTLKTEVDDAVKASMDPMVIWRPSVQKKVVDLLKNAKLLFIDASGKMKLPKKNYKIALALGITVVGLSWALSGSDIEVTGEGDGLLGGLKRQQPKPLPNPQPRQQEPWGSATRSAARLLGVSVINQQVINDMAKRLGMTPPPQT